jgi:hypothetical protein
MNPLFAAALWLTVFIFERMWAAQQTGKFAPAVEAGLLGLLLANIHSYDILIVWAVWLAYLCLRLILRQGADSRQCLFALILLLLPLPAVWQQWHLFRTEAVFHARALVPTPSPAIYWYLLGLGFLVPIGAYGASRLWRDSEADRSSAIFLGCWAVVGLLIPYLPFSFQRKLAMGVHIPWAILSGVGLAVLLRLRREDGFGRKGIALGAAVLLLSLTPLRWFAVALGNVESNWCEGDARLFLTGDETAAIDWLSSHADGSGVLAAPLQLGGIAGYLPALAGVSTFAGHWGETPGFSGKLRETIKFYSSGMSDEERRSFLRRTNLRFVYWSAAERNVGALASSGSPAPADLGQMAGLRAVFQSGVGENKVTLFRVE